MATLRLPDRTGRVPAVVVLHGSGGIDGRGAFYASALDQAGVATLEVFMFAPGKRPKDGPAATLTHAFGALKYLAARPEIDPERIAVMGFSFGASLTLRTASLPTWEDFADDLGHRRFAAHIALYPVCTTQSRMTVDPAANGFGAFTGFTARPILILAGGQDDYGAPDDCQRLIDLWHGRTGAALELEYYPNATHGWDGQSGREREIWDSAANRGRGGLIRMIPDPAVATESRDRAVEFARRVLFANRSGSLDPR
ncbi:MAG: dienelactone hydrolase family protein [Alphaproteobacteria bacterium]|nr:dienelactone hydrolase family protein [Alphaproteobacteria bacterium]